MGNDLGTGNADHSKRDLCVLSIVIPALDEQDAITETLRNCLDARAHIVSASEIDQVEIIVVSDGSTDRTEAIARSFDEVTVLAFSKNRGYGAALKAGFQHARGSVLGFLDGDGTADAACLGQMCQALHEHRADIVVGSRFGLDSRMPIVRALGNNIFALMLGILTKKQIRDTASGIRVLRRDALEDIYPLPDGLHFTPAMSARVLLEDKLKIIEVPITYKERVGHSKLSVVRDGLRFFTTIMQAALCFRPARPLLLVTLGLAIAALVVGYLPVATYIRFAKLEEWMIYRILLSSLLASAAGFFAATAIVAERIAALAHGRAVSSEGITGAIATFLSGPANIAVMSLLSGCAVFVIWPGLGEYFRYGQVTMHWSRAVFSSMLILFVTMLATSSIVMMLLDLIERHRRAPSVVFKPDRIRREHGTGGESRRG